MNPRSERFDFVALLVFAEGPRRRTLAPHVFSATHPEIAYRLALATGGEERHGHTFVGLAELEATTEDVPLIARTEGGDAAELVVPKEALSAFRDARWAGQPHDAGELDAALSGRPPLADVPGLDAVDWAGLSHAYGPATDVPLDLRRLASSDPDIRANALWQLGGSIYHQGDVFLATAAAVPFLVALASNPALPNRVEILEFLAEIAASGAATNPDKMRKAWATRQAMFPGLTYARPAAEMAELQIAAGLAVQGAMSKAADAMNRLTGDGNAAVGESARAVLAAMHRG